MKSARLRVAVFVAAVAASWLVLLLWAATVDWGAPLSPQAKREIGGRDFHAIFGRAAVQGGNLHVTAAAEDHAALQSTALANVVAEEFPILRYRFEDFPRTLELALVFRTAAQPADVQTIALPWPGHGASSFDLSRVEAWRGTVIELGFSEFATAQNVPPELGFKPFELVDVELWSPSWRGDLAALATDWFGAWPWSQRSVHALGRDTDSPRARPVVVFVAFAAAVAVVWAVLLFGRRRGQVAVLSGLALAWFALDLVWQGGLVQRLLATRALYAEADWPQRARIVGDSDLVDAADRIKATLANEPTQTRILVMAGTGYQLLRTIWHLLPLNATPFMLALASGADLPDGSVIAFVDNDSWHSDPGLRKLLARSSRIAPPHSMHTNGFEEGRIVMFRYRRAR